jgi:hypothetical protein
MALPEGARQNRINSTAYRKGVQAQLAWVNLEPSHRLRLAVTEPPYLAAISVTVSSAIPRIFKGRRSLTVTRIYVYRNFNFLLRRPRIIDSRASTLSESAVDVWQTYQSFAVLLLDAHSISATVQKAGIPKPRARIRNKTSLSVRRSSCK